MIEYVKKSSVRETIIFTLIDHKIRFALFTSFYNIHLLTSSKFVLRTWNDLLISKKITIKSKIIFNFIYNNYL